MNIKQKIIGETAAHFNDKNRSLKGTIQGVQCSYLDDDSRRCAVGRYIKDEFIGNVSAWEKRRFEHGDDTSADALFGAYPFDILKDEYLVEDMEFWLDLQKVHDRASNWDAFGLTAEGREQMEVLKRQYQ